MDQPCGAPTGNPAQTTFVGMKGDPKPCATVAEARVMEALNGFIH